MYMHVYENSYSQEHELIEDRSGFYESVGGRDDYKFVLVIRRKQPSVRRIHTHTCIHMHIHVYTYTYPWCVSTYICARTRAHTHTLNTYMVTGNQAVALLHLRAS